MSIFARVLGSFRALFRRVVAQFSRPKVVFKDKNISAVWDKDPSGFIKLTEAMTRADTIAKAQQISQT